MVVVVVVLLVVLGVLGRSGRDGRGGRGRRGRVMVAAVLCFSSGIYAEIMLCLAFIRVLSGIWVLGLQFRLLVWTLGFGLWGLSFC